MRWRRLPFVDYPKVDFNPISPKGESLGLSLPRVSMTPRKRGHNALILGNDQAFFKGAWRMQVPSKTDRPVFGDYFKPPTDFHSPTGFQQIDDRCTPPPPIFCGFASRARRRCRPPRSLPWRRASRPPRRVPQGPGRCRRVPDGKPWQRHGGCWETCYIFACCGLVVENCT